MAASGVISRSGITFSGQTVCIKISPLWAVTLAVSYQVSQPTMGKVSDAVSAIGGVPPEP
ncbi:hypothetical protein [Pantanalinema sp. GBBB05]|uniref:hypothetical protein n=1 Tax=Pantanalinema sp. GBBB05 TaxID=2604139 RepID=UPI001DEDDF12|nr:hypothetical protein [Pantanalinema sp. GBBB05]